MGLKNFSQIFENTPLHIFYSMPSPILTLEEKKRVVIKHLMFIYTNARKYRRTGVKPLVISDNDFQKYLGLKISRETGLVNNPEAKLLAHILRDLKQEGLILDYVFINNNSKKAYKIITTDNQNNDNLALTEYLKSTKNSPFDNLTNPDNTVPGRQKRFDILVEVTIDDTFEETYNKLTKKNDVPVIGSAIKNPTKYNSLTLDHKTTTFYYRGRSMAVDQSEKSIYANFCLLMFGLKANFHRGRKLEDELGESYQVGQEVPIDILRTIIFVHSDHAMNDVDPECRISDKNYKKPKEDITKRRDKALKDAVIYLNKRAEKELSIKPFAYKNKIFKIVLPK